MNILKSTVMVVVALLTLGQMSDAKAEGMDLVGHYELERKVAVSWTWGNQRVIWVGKNVGKDHSLVTVNFQGAKVSLLEGYRGLYLGSVGARITETRYYSNTGYVYAKIVVNARTYSDKAQTFIADVNYSINVYDDTSARNARSNY